MSSATRDQIRELSNIVFGQRYRLELMIAIDGSADGIVCLKDLAKELDVTASNLQMPLKDLTAAGLLTKDLPASSRLVYYRRNPSLAWGFARELGQLAEARARQAVAAHAPQ